MSIKKVTLAFCFVLKLKIISISYFPSAVLTPQPAAARRNTQADDIYAADDIISPFSDVRDKRGPGIDMCLCCSQKHLSFCCNACMRSRGLWPGSGGGQNEGGATESTMAALIFNRMTNLRSSACSCCDINPSRSNRCCQWCGDMDV